MRALRRLRRRRGPPRGAVRAPRPRARSRTWRTPRAPPSTGASSAPSGWPARSRSSPTRCSAIGEGGLLATDDDDVAALARSRRSHAMTSGTWDRHSGRTDTYDVTDLGFNYRLDEPRSALALSRLARPRGGHRGAPRAGARLPRAPRRPGRAAAALRGRRRGHLVLLRDAGDGARSRAPRRVPRPPVRAATACRPACSIPAIHEFSAYRERFPGVSLPRTELASRCEVTIPLYPHMTAEEQDRVCTAIEEALAA